MSHRTVHFIPSICLLAVILSLGSVTIAQEKQQDTTESSRPPSSRGTVLFDSSQRPTPEAEVPKIVDEDKSVIISDTDRAALTFTAYDLDAHLVPARAQLVMRARFSVRNDGLQTLTRVAFQISSSLRWERFALLGTGSPVAIQFVQHQISTDADHTGKAQEAILTLPKPLQPGSIIELSSFYSGELTQSAKRLERIGAPAIEASFTDWDSVASESTALRGFGNIIWYPTSSAPVFLGEGASLFHAVGGTKLRQMDAIIRLHLTVEYVGDPPVVAYFCGQRQPLVHVSENAEEPVAEAPGLATAEFSPRRLGFRVPSLFITDRAATKVDFLISAVTDRADASSAYAAGARNVEALLKDWLGKTPLATLDIFDHDGQSFEDGPFLVSSMSAKDASELRYVLVHSLAHAWFSSSQVWLDEGVAQFLTILWIEQSEGRDAALRMLQHQSNTLALAEPVMTKTPTAEAGGQSLIRARDEVYYRNKAAAVLWMLRSVVGDDALKQALQLYRHDSKRDQDPKEFERVLEQVQRKDLRWFFDDWVYQDRGLPDLSIVSITPRELPAQGDKSGGWLIAVEVRNDGDAVADVPVTVRSGVLTATERIRIPARSSSSTRIVFEGNPAEVLVNDGTVPEVRATTHSKQVILREK